MKGAPSNAFQMAVMTDPPFFLTRDTPNSAEVRYSIHTPERPPGLLLNLHHPDIALSRVVRKRHPEIGPEPEALYTVFPTPVNERSQQRFVSSDYVSLL